MTGLVRRLILVALPLAVVGCTHLPGHQGYINDIGLIDSVKPGVDNKDSVAKTLGRPSFAGQFNEADWYYVGRDTRSYAYDLPKPTSQLITHVHFDAQGNVASVQKIGMEQVAAIRANKDKTPTLGRKRTLLDDLFGNIGQVGGIGKGPGTADNPNGGQ